jgi:hypothetical protein
VAKWEPETVNMSLKQVAKSLEQVGCVKSLPPITVTAVPRWEPETVNMSLKVFR